MVIEQYNENWIKQFSKIENKLKNNLNDIIKIEHIGSTAILGMCGKPIIDIDIIIDNKNDFKNVKNDLENMGYIHEGDLGVVGREVFKRDNPHNDEILDNINHHLYVCAKDNEELNQHYFIQGLFKQK